MQSTLAPRRSKRAAAAALPAAHYAVAFESSLGWMAVSAGDDAVLAIAFGHPSSSRALAAVQAEPEAVCRIDEAPDALRDVCQRLVQFAAGEAVDFVDVALDLSHLTPFERDVVSACRRLGYGSSSSYGALAARVGRPGAARAVGRVMATNRFPLVVPCHRVLAAGGGLGGYSAPQGLAMKRRLLAMEGISARPPR